MNASPTFRWLGIAGLELGGDDQVLAIDPYFTRIPFWRQWIGRIEPDRALVREKIPVCRHVLVTHAHWDHLMDVPEVANSTGASVYGSANTCQLLRLLGVPGERVHEIRSGDSLNLGPFKVKVLPSEHMKVPWFSPGPITQDLRPPLRARDYRMDSCFSFLISVGNRVLLTDPGERPDPVATADILLVSPYHDNAYLRSLLPRVNPKVVIPNHWDDLWRPLSKPVRPMMGPPSWSFPPVQRVNLSHFKQAVEQLDTTVRVLIPEMFTVYELADIMDTLR